MGDDVYDVSVVIRQLAWDPSPHRLDPVIDPRGKVPPVQPVSRASPLGWVKGYVWCTAVKCRTRPLACASFASHDITSTNPVVVYSCWSAGERCFSAVDLSERSTPGKTVQLKSLASVIGPA